MLAVGVPVCFCLLILYDAIRKAVRASERSPRSTRSTVYPGEGKLKKLVLLFLALRSKVKTPLQRESWCDKVTVDKKT